uniref:DUF4939 domain-containing protein n=1 Tax=Sinocyclocheilus rhinocerous TaxID=307959 RepID=A0A673JX42_9TELE
MFVFGLIACLSTIVSASALVYDERSACFSDFDPLPDYRHLFKALTFNKLPLMDSNQTPASLLQNTSPPMNPAEVSNLQTAFSYQAEMLQKYQEQLTKLQTVNEHLTHYIRSLPPPTPKTVSLALPDKFDGTAEQCKGFIRQVQVYLDHQGERFESEGKKCAFIMTLLTGRAIDWAAAVWDSDSRLRNSVTYFIQQLREVFEYPHGGKDVSTQLINLTQGNRSAAEFAIEFRTLAAQSGWNDVALKAMFHKSLNCDLQAELACKGEESSFSDFVTLAIRIDNLMRQAPKRRSGKGGQTNDLTPNPVEMSSPEEPMQINASRLSESERERRRHQRHFYCGESGHRSLGCPHKAHFPCQNSPFSAPRE